MRRLMAVLVIAGILSACADQPTAVNDTSSGPTVNAMQTRADDPMPPGGGWTLIYQSTEAEADPATSPWVYEVSCLGTGNSVQYTRWWWWSKDFVTTPSGIVHATQRITWTETGYIAPNGDVWQLQKLVQPLIARWVPEGGEWVMENTAVSWYVNLRTGQRMKETAKYRLTSAVNPVTSYADYTSMVGRQYHCQLMGN